MPAKNPRLTITLNPRLYDLISRFAALQQCPKSRVVSDILEPLVTPLSRTIALLEAARDAPAEIQRNMLSVASGVERDLLDAAGRVNVEVSEQLRRIEDQANPHMVTRGSGVDFPLDREVKGDES